MRFRLFYREPYVANGFNWYDPQYVAWSDKEIGFEAPSDTAAIEHVRKFLAGKAITWGGFEYQANANYLVEEFAPRLV